MLGYNDWFKGGYVTQIVSRRVISWISMERGSMKENIFITM